MSNVNDNYSGLNNNWNEIKKPTTWFYFNLYAIKRMEGS